MFVKMLKEKVRLNNSLDAIILPVAIADDELENFNSTHPEQLWYWTLGGNHLREALSQLTEARGA